MTEIYDPISIGSLKLKNRIIMAPMTRGRAEEGGVPGDLMVEYYSERADAGLIITEATAISVQGSGWMHAPGIWNDSQVDGWKKVTKAVHDKGGKIFLQLWHMGRVSHPDFLNGELPVGPSAIAAHGETYTKFGKKAYVTPRALTTEEIENIVGDYVKAAQRAIDAGFDGVEIHGANGYLIDQFIRDGSNLREDIYGGSIDHRLVFLLKIINDVVVQVGSERVGLRLSPTSGYNDMKDSDPIKTFTRAALLVNIFKIAYLHIIEPVSGEGVPEEPVVPHIRKVYDGVLIVNGGYNVDLANKALKNREADAIAFGVPFLANPDLVHRFEKHLPLNAPDFSTLYTQGPKGYTDYPLYHK